MKQKFLTLVVAVVGSTLLLTSCSTGTGSTSSTDSSATQGSSVGASYSQQQPITITIGCTAVPHAEILEECKEPLAEEGINLDIKTFSDYTLINKALDEGDIDASYFETLPYLDAYNQENGSDLVNVGPVHIEPMGVYSDKYTSLDDLPDNATIAVPNDVSNEARALQLLANNGLIEVDPSAGENATKNDVTSNPKNIQFEEVDAATLPKTVQDVDAACINSNYAMEAGMNPVEDSIAIESADGSPYVNCLVVRSEDANAPAIQAIYKELTSDHIRDFINGKYNGAVVPAF